MSKYNRKQRIKPEDEFVSFWHKAFNVLSPYARAIGVTLGSAVLVWFLVYGIGAYFERRTENAAEAFGRAVKIYDADLITDDNAAQPKPDEENPVPRFKTAKERADATLAELASVDSKYGSTDVAKDVALFQAGVFYDLGRFDDAEAAYRRFLKHAGKQAPPSPLAQEGIGLALEARGKLDDALGAYKALEPAKGDYFRDRALYDQARVLGKKGDKKKAVELYQQVLTKMPTTPLRDEIQTQLTLLEGP
jgi:tetratricopeptide (TPR) repeat protein